MADNFDNPYSANLIGLWDFRDGFENNDTGLGDGIAQDGAAANGGGFGAGWFFGNGDGSRFDVDDGDDSAFDLSEGTIVTQFKQNSPLSGDDQTVVSRGLTGQDGLDPNYFEIRVTANGAVEAYHADSGESALLTTPDGFLATGDIIKVTYAWNDGGVQMVVENTTQATSATDGADVSGLSLDLTDASEQSFAIGSRETTEGTYDQAFDGSIDYVAVLDDDVLSSGLDGVVEGSAGDDLIDVDYLGDPEGDRIDNNDAINPADGPNDDLVNAGAGNDTVIAGAGDDTVHGGGGDDSLVGGEGDDVLSGDTNAPGVTSTPGREVFEWDRAPDPNDNDPIDNDDPLDGGFSQDTGTVTVDFSITEQDAGIGTSYSSDQQNVVNINTGGGTADDTSALGSLIQTSGDSIGYRLDFSGPVEDVSFRINDIDGGGVVQVTAYDANGNPTVVNLSGGPLLTLSDEDGVSGDDTAISQGGYASEDNPNYSLLVTIPGPITRIEIDHSQDGGTSGIQVTDVYFDPIVTDPVTDAGDDTIDGGIGADIITGGEGDDSLIGGDGNDTIDGGDGSDTVTGDDGDDVIDTSGSDGSPDRGIPDVGGAGATPADTDPDNDRDTVDGGAGNDSITTGDDADLIMGGTGDDTLDGGIDDDTIDGGDDDDVIIGGEGTDELEGGAGDDTIYGGNDPSDPDALDLVDVDSDGNPVDPDPDNNRDTISGGDGNDVIFGQDDADSLDGGAGDDSIDGGIDDDTIDGGAGDDTLIGGQGDDNILGGDGNDSVAGDDGDDVIDTSNTDGTPDRGVPSVGGVAAIPADTDPDDDRDTVDGGAGDDSITTGDDADLITGGTGDDTIDGGIDDDTIDGGDDDDLIIGGEGADELEGGSGNDTLYGGDAPGTSDPLSLVDVDEDGTPVDPDPENNRDTILGGDGDDVIYGMDDADSLDGGTGDDTIDGGIDDDTIIGGAGDDSLIGGQGDDSIDGGDGNDDVSGGDGDDIIDTSGSTPLVDRGFAGYSDGTIVIPAIPADGDDANDRDTVDGGAGDDTILTGDDADVITGGAGSDSIDGGIDDDTIDGGTEADVIIGGEGSDSILGGTGDDTIYGGLDPAFPDALNITDDGSDGRPVDPDPTNGMDTILGGDGNDVIFGQDDDDSIDGGTGDDSIDAGIDDDTVTGGEGDDTILGGQGADDLSGGLGEDQIDLGSDDQDDTADGGLDSDTFTGVGVGDTIVGGENPDDSDFDTLDLTGAAEAANAGGSLRVDYTPGDPESGTVTFLDADGVETGTAVFSEIENVVIPCFTPGTLIATPQGERKVEDLQVGDRVITRDNGIQAIRWMGQRTLEGAEMNASPKLQPVLIREGALGNGLPERDMLVSPNHRVLVANDKTALYFEDREVLVAAKHLVGLKGVDVVETAGITYLHFMFDQHEVVLSDGAWTESFQPGDQSLRGLDAEQRNEIFALFPELKDQEGRTGYTSARRSLKKHEARLLVH